MNWSALHFLLLSGLLPCYYAQSTSLTGCEGPPALCCSGQNNSCNRNGCYCDEACVKFVDCCSDYNLTCTQTTSTPSNSSNGSTQMTMNTTPASTVSSTIGSSQTNSTASATSLESITTGTTPSEVTNATSSPADGNSKTVVLHLKASLIFLKGESNNGISQALSAIFAQSLKKCESCLLRIKHLKPT